MNLDFLEKKLAAQAAEWLAQPPASIKAALLRVAGAAYSEYQAGDRSIYNPLKDAAAKLIDALMGHAMRPDSKVRPEVLALLDALENESDPWLAELGLMHFKMLEMGVSSVRRTIKGK